MAELSISEFSQAQLDGTGTFDVLMRAIKGHIDEEFKNTRLKGPEYATVYLGSLNLAMQQGLQFLLNKRKNDLEAQLLAEQIQLTRAQVAVAEKQIEITDAELAIKQAQVRIAEAEVEIAEAKLVNIPKEGALLDAQAAHTAQQTSNLVAEKLSVEARTALTNQQVLNAVVEGKVLQAQECKLKVDYQVGLSTVLKIDEEAELLKQKTATEKAQVSPTGVDANSVIGKQKGLYQAQTDGFARDAEHKAAKLMTDTWSVRRTTDEGTVADATNMLYDTAIGRAINKMLAGVGA